MDAEILKLEEELAQACAETLSAWILWRRAIDAQRKAAEALLKAKEAKG